MNKDVTAGTITAPDGKSLLGVFRDKDKIYAGFIFNSGVSRTWEMDYDENFTFYQNLEALNEIIEQEWTNR